MRLTRRQALAAAGGVIATAGGVWGYRRLTAFPPETTPEGVYWRVAALLNADDLRGLFAYLEEAAQSACFTIREYRRKARLRIDAAYPEPERGRLLAAYEAHANAPDGADVWLDIASSRGYVGRLRRDLSSAAKVEVNDDVATIVTTRGTRYGMRRRADGIWGLTLFTSELVAEAERATRDAEVVDQAADDYANAKK